MSVLPSCKARSDVHEITASTPPTTRHANHVGTLSAAADSDTAVTLTWAAVPNTKGYRVYGGSSPAFDGLYNVVADELTATTFTDDRLAPNTTYYYAVYAMGDTSAVQVGQTAAVTTLPRDGERK